MSNPFWTSLTPVPAAGKGVPYNWFNKLLDNTLALKQGDQPFDYLAGSQVIVTTTGTINDHNPTGMDVQWNGTASASFTGILAHGAGDIRIYHNVTTAQAMSFAHESSGSTAANRFKLPAASQYIGPNGSIGFKYDSSQSRWYPLWINPGKPIDVTYNSGLYGASGGGTWTFPSGATNQITFTYSQRGGYMDLTFYATNTTTSGTVTNLTLLIPGGFTALRQTVSPILDIRSNAVTLTGVGVVAASGSTIAIYRQDRTSWPAGAANNDVAVSMSIPLT